MSATANDGPLNRAALRMALSRHPVIRRDGAFRYGRRQFATRTISAVVAAGDAIRVGNFVVRSLAELGQPHMIAPTPFEKISPEAQTLLRRAVVSEVVLESFTSAAYEIVIAGLGLIDGFTIKPNDAGERAVMSRVWHTLTGQQRQYLAMVRDTGSAKPVSRAGMRRLQWECLIDKDGLTSFGIRTLERYWKIK